ncbi:MAG: 7-carboxy-7-deazaguanine synthase QueE [Candidatus Omnitrophica bacterium]|nr:7-carboxy-7-deazaguanine synthase QueE [Candidatus Omnitrophota bacterium]
MQPTARVIEIFSSIQGEGVYVGHPHLFVRFWNCNMTCGYCDTDYKGPYEEYSVQQLSSEVERLLLEDGPFQAVSLTGGEPLLWKDFLKAWLPWLKNKGQRTYLETNGTLPQAFAEVLHWIDIIAMDFKPPSATFDRAYWKEHEEFLRLAYRARKEIFVKIIATRQTTDVEMEYSLRLIASVHSRIPVVLQPVTPWGIVSEGPSPEQIQRWQWCAGSLLKDVRVIPQVHRLLGVR